MPTLNANVQLTTSIWYGSMSKSVSRQQRSSLVALDTYSICQMEHHLHLLSRLWGQPEFVAISPTVIAGHPKTINSQENEVAKSKYTWGSLWWQLLKFFEVLLWSCKNVVFIIHEKIRIRLRYLTKVDLNTFFLFAPHPDNLTSIQFGFGGLQVRVTLVGETWHRQKKILLVFSQILS